MSPWYIDANRLLEFTPNETQISIIKRFKNSDLIENLEESRKLVINRFVENGVSMINEINSFKPSLVIDLACGINPYKNVINNIVGVDITAHQDVDYVCNFRSTPFKDDVADVILCLNGYAFKDSNRAIFNEIKRIAKNGAKVYCRVGYKPFLKANIEASDYINGVAREYGFTFFHELKNATYTNNQDNGVYFIQEGGHSLEVKKRPRWVWTWVVNK